LSKFIHYPGYAHTIPIVTPGFIFIKLIFGRIFWIVYREPIFGGAYIQGAYLQDFTVLQIL